MFDMCDMCYLCDMCDMCDICDMCDMCDMCEGVSDVLPGHTKYIIICLYHHTFKQQYKTKYKVPEKKMSIEPLREGRALDSVQQVS